jgi:hypothetical protein
MGLTGLMAPGLMQSGGLGGGGGGGGAGGYQPYQRGPVPFSSTFKKTAFHIDIDALPGKPWDQPGADQSDYFNFGFNEVREEKGSGGGGVEAGAEQGAVRRASGASRARRVRRVACLGEGEEV